jgi:hypothetical protein
VNRKIAQERITGRMECAFMVRASPWGAYGKRFMLPANAWLWYTGKMLATIEGLKKDLTELAGILNRFRSEAVQLRVLDGLFTKRDAPTPAQTAQRKMRLRAGGISGRRRARKPMSATAALNVLVSKGYFKRRRLLMDVVQACEDKAGAKVTAVNLGGVIAKFSEEGKLRRAKNDQGKFEYWLA